MNIEHKNGLLYTSLEIEFNGKSRTIDNIVIDTGASHTLISQDCVDEIGIRVALEDEIVTSFGIGGKEHAFMKKVDKIKMGEFIVENCPLDFTVIEYEDINGLLGLDILLSAGVKVQIDGIAYKSK